MKRLSPFSSALCAAAAALWLSAGCVTSTRTPVSPSGFPTDRGVAVRVERDAILLYNRPVSRKTLVRRLREEEGGATGERAILLQAGPGVGRSQLEDLRDFLVRNGVPRVVLVSRPIVTATAPGADAPPPDPRRPPATR